MRYSLIVAAVLALLIRSANCKAFDHATIIGDFYNYQFCESCDHSLYRYEDGVYHIPHFDVGDGEAAVLLFSVPEELKPFDHAQLKVFLNSYYVYPPLAFDWSVYGFDGVIGNVGPAGLAQSVYIASPYSIIPGEFNWYIDVTDFLRSAKHSQVSFALTANATQWTMSYPQLLVYPVPETGSVATVFIAAGCALLWLRVK